nr:MAG TPA: hypothetical protein [Caudoviricetes sp.]
MTCQLFAQAPFGLAPGLLGALLDEGSSSLLSNVK